MQQPHQTDSGTEPDHTGRGLEEHDPERNRDKRDGQAEPAPVLLDESRAFGRAGVIARRIAQAVEVVDDECAGKRTCGEMTDCAEARFYLSKCGLTRLDGNGDGVPCESLCSQ